MDDTSSAFSRFARPASRRGVLTSLVGSAAASILSGARIARALDYPPVFRTAKYQFTLVQPPRQIPVVSLLDVKGRHVQLSPAPGKVLLINLWATWCEACQFDLPLLERFHDAIGDRVKVAAVSTDTAASAKIESFLQRFSIRTLPIYLDPYGQLARNPNDAPSPLPLYGTPMTYLVTPSGRVAGYILGIADWLAKDAQNLLAYYASS